MLGKVCEHGSLKRQCRICELEAEVTRLSGKTGFCLQCEKYARALENIYHSCRLSWFTTSNAKAIAKSALGKE